jgi:hypothetical protein
MNTNERESENEKALKYLCDARPELRNPVAEEIDRA